MRCSVLFVILYLRRAGNSRALYRVVCNYCTYVRQVIAVRCSVLFVILYLRRTGNSRAL